MMSIALPLYIVGCCCWSVWRCWRCVQGARRWLNIGVARIQPSERWSAMPLMLARKMLPVPRGHAAVSDFFVAGALLLVPVAFHRQTALDLGAGGGGGLSTGWFCRPGVVAPDPSICGRRDCRHRGHRGDGDAICQPGRRWPGMRNTQKHRVCTLLDPPPTNSGLSHHPVDDRHRFSSSARAGAVTADPPGFSSERHTDFFAGLTRNLGFAGALFLAVLYILLIFRGLFIAAGAPTLFSRLLALAH